MNNETETAYLRKAHASFEASTLRLDARIVARLREARARAVAAAGQNRPLWHVRPWALPAGAAAILVVAVAAGVLWLNVNSQPAVPFAASNSEDMAIVLSNDNLDMYADMDFYRWLQAQQQQQQQNATQNDSGGNNNG
ncbi:MAG: hypothetical protein WBR15_08435 [Gammaproteobacteria bacterium]